MVAIKSNKWKISLENERGTYSVEANVVSLDDAMEELVRPVLLAAGLGEKWVDEYIYGNENGEEAAIEAQNWKDLQSRLNDALSWCRGQEDEGTMCAVIYEGLRARLDRIMVAFFNGL